MLQLDSELEFPGQASLSKFSLRAHSDIMIIMIMTVSAAAAAVGVTGTDRRGGPGPWQQDAEPGDAAR
jgi:hypothetical protein